MDELSGAGRFLQERNERTSKSWTCIGHCVSIKLPP